MVDINAGCFLLLFTLVPLNVFGHMTCNHGDPYNDVLSRDMFLGEHVNDSNSGNQSDTGEESHTGRMKRKAINQSHRRWPNATIPYEIMNQDFTARHVASIKKAMKEWSDGSCIQFRPATSRDRDKIHIKDGKGCNSDLGRTGGTQSINLQRYGCRQKSTYLHELGHSIGLVHEHQVPDRDKYLTINYDNIKEGYKIWFLKYSTRDVNQFGVPYDYRSVMNYRASSFSKNRLRTIVSKDPDKQYLLGHAQKLSFSDLKVVNLMYKCNKHCKPDPSCKDPGYLDKNCRCVCPSGVDCTRDNGDDAGSRSTDNPHLYCSNEYHDAQCKRMAERGDCESNIAIMMVFCKKACGRCKSSCKNTIADYICDRRTFGGWCETNLASMSVKCRDSCGLCGVLKCTNKLPDDKCKELAETGGCARKAKNYTLAKCKKTCHICETGIKSTVSPATTTKSPVSTKKTGKGCTNLSPDDKCKKYAARGHCEINPGIMWIRCRKACGICKAA